MCAVQVPDSGSGLDAPAASAELLLQILELALQGVQARQGHRVVLGGEVDDGVSALADGLEGGTGTHGQLLRRRYGGVRGRRGTLDGRRGLLLACAATARDPAVTAADRLQVRTLVALLLPAAQSGLLLLALVLADLVDRLVQRAHVLQKHQRPGAVRLAGRAQPADDPDLRQRARDQALL